MPIPKNREVTICQVSYNCYTWRGRVLLYYKQQSTHYMFQGHTKKDMTNTGIRWNSTLLMQKEAEQDQLQ